MVYRRSDGTGWTFQARTRSGWRALTFRGSKPKAARLAEIWEQLAQQERAWDILDPILQSPRKDRQRKLGELLDFWTETRGALGEVRRRLHDPNLEPYVAQWIAVYRQQRPKNADKALHRVRCLIPQDVPLPRSKATTAWLNERLYAYSGKAGTKRGVHAAWSGFFRYLTDVHGLFEVNPLSRVKPPAPDTAPIRFLELDQVKRVIGWQTSQERSVFYALAYGTAIETGVSLQLTRADLNPADREIRAAGTKAHNRDRVARVSAWAWAIIWEYAKNLLPTARLFPADWRDDQVSHWHEETLKALGLPHMKLHNARHHWAVSQLRAGVPIELVRRQLGHSTPMLTLRVYGAFIPSGDDRAKWEQVVQADTERREAK